MYNDLRAVFLGVLYRWWSQPASLGAFHNWWFQRPWKVAWFAVILEIIASGLAVSLGVFWDSPRCGPTYTGLFNISWFRFKLLYDSPPYCRTYTGLLNVRNISMAVALPIGLVLVPWVYRTTRVALCSLDVIICPKEFQPTDLPFSAVYSPIFLKWLRPFIAMNVFLAAFLTIVAEPKCVFSPLWRSASQVFDWSTMATVLPNEVSVRFCSESVMLMLLNLCVYGMQCIAIYSVFLVFFIVIHPLIVFFNASLSERETWLDAFTLRWDLADPSGRCGLALVDRVFIAYLLFLTIVFTASAISIGTRPPADRILASHMLIFFNSVMLLPVASFVFILPAWLRFPNYDAHGKQTESFLGGSVYSLAVSLMGLLLPLIARLLV